MEAFPNKVFYLKKKSNKEWALEAVFPKKFNKIESRVWIYIKDINNKGYDYESSSVIL